MRRFEAGLVSAALATMGVTACLEPPRIDSKFQTYAAPDLSRGQVVERAVYVDPSRAAVISAHGGVVLGVVRMAEGSVNGTPCCATFEDYAAAAPSTVAREGGTHFTLAASGYASATRVSHPFATYLVWRVDPERFEDLPEELRPKAPARSEK